MTLPADPARPVKGKDGLSAREYAAIHLRVPDSGEAWLDKMILRSVHLDFMMAATSGMKEYLRKSNGNTGAQMERLAHHAHSLAHRMMKKHYPDYAD